MWRFLVILCLIALSQAYVYEQQEADYDASLSAFGESDEEAASVYRDHRRNFADFGAQTGDFGAFSWHATYYDTPVVRRE